MKVKRCEIVRRGLSLLSADGIGCQGLSRGIKRGDDVTGIARRIFIGILRDVGAHFGENYLLLVADTVDSKALFVRARVLPRYRHGTRAARQ